MRRFILAVLLFLFAPLSAFCQWHSIGDIDTVVSRDQHTLTVRSGRALVQVQMLADGIARVRFAPSGSFAPDQSWAVVNPPGPAPEARIEETPERFLLSSAALRVTVSRKPLRITVLDSTGRVISQDDSAKGMAWSGTEVRVWKAMPFNEHYYGFGEKAGKLDRSATHMTMWNSDIPAYSADTDPLYETIPFFYGIREGRAYGIFMDNSYRSSFDMGKESRSSYSFGAENGDLNYYYFAGPDPKTILSRFTGMTGRMQLPPLWSLGYQQCRWSYVPEKRVREIARGFRSNGIPCDMLYLDIDYMDGYRIFTWNTNNFPDPQRMISDLAKEGFKLAVIVDPGIKADSSYHAFRSGLAGNDFVRYPDGTLYTGKVWPGVCAFPDFTSDHARKWWGDQFSVLTNAGVRGFWNDMNEPSVFDVPTKTIDLNVVHDDNGLRTTHAKSHNIYGLEMTRATYDGVRRLLPDERPFLLTRASYAGGWRYSAAWTGDNTSTWGDLAMAASMCLNLSISGQPFVGSDIGGFIGYPSGELFARWLQLGVFTPLMRAHSVINEKNKEPWEFGNEYTAINRTTIELRYRFLPYIYTVMEQASRTGLPAMRPMIFEFPQEQTWWERSDEFMFGDQLLVAPVLSPGVRSRDVSLPAGSWYNFWNDSLYQGQRTVTVEAPADRLPLFVRAGAIIPTRQVVQYTSQKPIDPLTLTVYPGGEGQSYLSSYYEDDGQSFAYTKGAYLRRTLSQQRSGSTLRMVLSACEGSYVPPGRTALVRITNVPSSPSAVTINGHTISRGARPSSGHWTYDAKARTLQLGFPDERTSIEITVAAGH